MEAEKITICAVLYLIMGALFWCEIKTRNSVLKRMKEDCRYRETKFWKSLLFWFPAVFLARGETKLTEWYFKK